MTGLRGTKIVLMFGSLELGGAERQGLLVAEALKYKHGADVEIWGMQDKPGRLSELCEGKKIPWRSCDFNWGKISLTRMVSLAKLTVMLRKARPDIILGYTAVPNLACGIIWRATGARCFVWNQRDEGLLLKKKFWHKLAVKRTSLFLCNSAAGKSFLQDFYGVGSQQISVIRNGVACPEVVDTRSFSRQRFSLPEGAPVACMLANLHRDKDHETLLRAWALVQLCWRDDPKPVLLLAGRADEGAERLRQLACSTGISDYVRFLGRVDDVPGLLSAIDLCVHSSRSEGLPNAVLEAMAAGVPVVGSDIPGIREAVGPDGYPFLATAGNAEDLAEKIVSALTTPTASMKVASQLKQRVRDLFSTERMVHDTVEFLCRRLEQGRDLK